MRALLQIALGIAIVLITFRLGEAVGLAKALAIFRGTDAATEIGRAIGETWGGRK